MLGGWPRFAVDFDCFNVPLRGAANIGFRGKNVNGSDPLFVAISLLTSDGQGSSRRERWAGFISGGSLHG